MGNNLKRIPHWGLAVVFIAGCGRDFSAPPNKLSIESIFPTSAFLGAVVSINGKNFDPEPSNNLVFFGNSSAAIIDASPEQLHVLVPQLPVDDTVSITVSASMGRDTSSEYFHYLGPGHPLNERIDHILKLESGPSSVSMFLPSSRLASVIPALVTNTASGTVSLMDLDSGIQVAFGVKGQPTSGLVLPLKGLQGSQDTTTWPQECWQEVSRSLVFLTTIEDTQDNTLRPALVENILVIAIRDPDGDNETCSASWHAHGAQSSTFSVMLEPAPEMLQIDPQDTLLKDPPFMPGQIYSACLDLQSDLSGDDSDWFCNDFLLIVTDLYRPVMSLFLYSNRSGQYYLTPLGPVVLENKDSFCASDADGDRIGKILDIDHIAGNLHFDVIVKNRPEIWEISLHREIGGFNLDGADLVWPKESTMGQISNLSSLAENGICSQTLTAITSRTDPDSDTQNLLVSNGISKKIFELSLIELPGNNSAMVPTKIFSMDSPVFSLQTAMGLADDGTKQELLYAAAENGLALLDIGQPVSGCNNDEDCPQGRACNILICEPEPMRIIDFLSLPGSRGNGASLARYGLSLDDKPDIVAFADTPNNQLITTTASTSLSGSRPLMVANTMPQIAVSQFGDSLYLANPMDNSIQVINMDTGTQKSKFSIHGGNTFGATGMMCIHDNGEDLLIIPLADEYMRPDLGVKTFNDLVLRKLNSMGQITSLGLLENPDEIDLSSSVDTQAHEFNEILVGQSKKALFFVLYAQNDTGAGLVWPAVINGTMGPDSMIVDGEGLRQMDSNIDPEARNLAPTVKIARLDPDVNLLALWEPVAQGRNDDVGRISIYPVDDHTSAPIFEMLVEPPVSTLVSDVAILVKRGFIRIFFTLPDAGKILLIRSSYDGSNQDQTYIQTPGAPFKIFFSPDSKRLFVLHRSEGKLTVIDADCFPITACEDDSECETGRTCSLGFCIPSNPCKPGAFCSKDDDCEGTEERCSSGVCTSDAGSSDLCPEGTMCDLETSTCVPTFCENATSSINMDTSASNVVFSPGGDKVFVTHHQSNRITVIE